VSPATRSLNPITSPASHRRATPGIDDNTVSVIESGSQTGITIAASHDFCIWPNVTANERERSAIFLSAATSKENSRAINLFWQLGKNFAQAFRGCQAQIRRWQFALSEDSKFYVSITTRRPGLHQHPCGFCSTSLDAENALD
jgi:hypothetical protein